MKLGLKLGLIKHNFKKEILTRQTIITYLKKKIVKNYITSKIIQKNKNDYNPEINGKKYIIIMACHCDSELKLTTISNNIKYFSFKNVDKIVINSEGLPFNSKIEEICQIDNNTKYCEIPNTSFCDYGKWLYALNNLFDYNQYDYIVFINDSFIINNSINHFFNLIPKYNSDLFGYNDSTQNRYHYQSYLFSLKNSAIPVFIKEVSNPNLIINNQEDVIRNFELKMTDWFQNKISFLNIGNSFLHRGLNIFSTNDKLYFPLIKTGLLPFVKVKRIKN